MSSSKFHPGQVVRKKDGDTFSNHKYAATVIDIDNYPSSSRMDTPAAVWIDTGRVSPTYVHEAYVELVEPVADESDGWQTVTQADADVLNRLGVEYVSRLQIKIKPKR